jgi:predicted PurR-regulated permease PerM
LSLRHSPFNAEKTKLLIAHFRNICSALVISTLVVGFLQGILFTMGCAIARMPNLPLIGLATFLASFIPAVGSSPVYISMIVYAFIVGEWWQVAVVAFFAALVAISDNTVRPLLLRTGAHMHPIIALTSVLAGVASFGFAGIFFGPILMTMLFQIYSATFESTAELAVTEASPHPDGTAQSVAPLDSDPATART